jgi:mono/diheme cytochrome c family protein
VIESKDAYDAWVLHTAPAPQNLGRSEWIGACAKCHGLQGEGDYGPKISNNSLLTQPDGLERLLRNGQNKMPPVGRGWSKEQLKALEQYLAAIVYKAPTNGG